MTSAETRFLAIALGLLAGSVSGQELPAMDEYGFGFPVQSEQDADYYQVEIPYAVYTSAADPRLRDLGVYDARGRAVPRFLESPRPERRSKERKVTLRAFPLNASASENPEALKLLLKTDGARLEVETTGSAPPPAPPSPAHYIVDLREIEEALDAVELDWSATEAPFLGSVTVQGSDDLQSWREAGTGAIASLSDGSANVTANRVSLRHREHDYLRISWTGLPNDWSLSGIVGVFDGQHDAVDRSWLELQPQRDDEGALVFEARGAPLVDRVQLQLPDDNVVVRASVYSWSDSGQRWAHQHSGPFYRWQRDDTSVSGPTAEVRAQRAQRWRVVIEKGAPDLSVGLRLGWRPDQLTFVAQGEPPYTVAVGRADDALFGFPQEAAFADSGVLAVTRDTGQGGTARLGDRYGIGGSTQLEVQRQIPWTTVTLWLALAIGVGLVGWMALRLVRQLDQ